MTRYEDIDTDEANLLLFFVYFELIRYESANRLAHKRATGFQPVQYVSSYLPTSSIFNPQVLLTVSRDNEEGLARDVSRAFAFVSYCSEDQQRGNSSEFLVCLGRVNEDQEKQIEIEFYRLSQKRYSISRSHLQRERVNGRCGVVGSVVALVSRRVSRALSTRAYLERTTTSKHRSVAGVEKRSIVVSAFYRLPNTCIHVFPLWNRNLIVGHCSGLLIACSRSFPMRWNFIVEIPFEFEPYSFVTPLSIVNSIQLSSS